MSVRRMIWTLSVFVATLGAPCHLAGAQTLDATFRSDIEELLDVTGALQIGAQFANMMTASFLDALKQTQPDVPPRVFELVSEVINEETAKALGTGALRSTLVSIYAKHYTPADVRGLLAFYRSDLGQKVIRALPSVLQESNLAGQEWGKGLVPAIESALERRLRSEGLLK